MVWNHTHTIATVFLCLLRVCGDFIKHDYHEEWEPSVQIYITYVYIKYIHSIHNTYIGESIYMKKVCYLLSCVWLFGTPGTPALLPMWFSRQEYRSGLSFPFGAGCQGIFLTQGSNSGLLHCRQILYYLSHHGNPCEYICTPIYACILCICVCITYVWKVRMAYRGGTEGFIAKLSTWKSHNQLYYLVQH